MIGALRCIAPRTRWLPSTLAMASATVAHLAPLLDTQELRLAFVKFPTLCKAIEVKPRSVWAAMDDGAAEEEIFAVADEVFTMVDTDKSGDIQVSELKALLLADDWEDALVEKVFTGIDFDASGEIDRGELRTAFVKHPSLRSALGKQIKA